MRCIHWIFLCYLSLFTFGCSVNEPEESLDSFRKAKIRILAIGNSFTENATLYLPNILENLYPNNEVLFCKLTKGGTALKDHYSNILSNKNEYNYSFANDGVWNPLGRKSLKSILNSEDWDFVIIQQLSGYSGDFTTYQPYLNNIINTIREYNESVHIGWQMTWAYSHDSTHPDFSRYNHDSKFMYEKILETLESVKPYVDLIIPSGTLIEELRETELNTAHDLTADGYHLVPGLPCYAISCLWHEIILSPLTFRSSLGTGVTSNISDFTITDYNSGIIFSLIEKCIQLNH